jgi:hypothetical protein
MKMQRKKKDEEQKQAADCPRGRGLYQESRAQHVRGHYALGSNHVNVGA